MCLNLLSEHDSHWACLFVPKYTHTHIPTLSQKTTEGRNSEHTKKERKNTNQPKYRPL